MIASDFDIVEIRKELKPEHVDLLVDLMAHKDETMREWAAAAVVGLRDERSVKPLLLTLRKGTVSRDGKYEAALALLATAPAYPDHVQRRIASETVLRFLNWSRERHCCSNNCQLSKLQRPNGDGSIWALSSAIDGVNATLPGEETHRRRLPTARSSTRLRM